MPNSSNRSRESDPDHKLGVDTRQKLESLFRAYTAEEYLSLVQENWHLLRNDKIDIDPDLKAAISFGDNFRSICSSNA